MLFYFSSRLIALVAYASTKVCDNIFAKSRCITTKLMTIPSKMIFFTLFLEVSVVHLSIKSKTCKVFKPKHHTHNANKVIKSKLNECNKEIKVLFFI